MSLARFYLTFAIIGSATIFLRAQNVIKPVINDNTALRGTTKIVNSDFIALARKYLGTVEEHNIVTSDSYILKTFRIPGNINNVVLLLHGFVCSSDDFLVRGNTSLVYTLARKGYDVWVLNFRGNRYSRSHRAMNPDFDPKFWQYSMHEMGLYDLTAVIDFVLNRTGQKQLSLLGYSEGNAAAFILLSKKPEYNDKINVMVSLAPAIHLTGTGVTLSTMIEISPVMINFLKIIRLDELLGFFSLERTLINNLCSQGILAYDLCVKIIVGAVTGQVTENLEQEFFYKALQHFPAGTSIRNFDHYAQIGRSGNFSEFDYGTFNYMMYGTKDPPKYNLKNVKCKVALVASRNDQVAGIREIEQLKKEFPNVVSYKIVDYDKFAHLDFIWGRNAHKVLYPHVVSVLDKFRLR